MSDLFQTGVQWLSATRITHLTQDVVIRRPGTTGVTLKATVPSCQADTIQQGVKIQTQYFDFMFLRQDLLDNDIPLERGIEIVWNDKIFQIAFDKRLLWYYNDPFHLDIVIQTTYQKDVPDPLENITFDSTLVTFDSTTAFTMDQS